MTKMNTKLKQLDAELAFIELDKNIRRGNRLLAYQMGFFKNYEHQKLYEEIYARNLKEGAERKCQIKKEIEQCKL